MIDLKQLGFPGEIIKSVSDFGDDISIDSYSFRGANGWVLFGDHNIMNKRIALKYYDYGDNVHDEVQLLTQIECQNVLKILNARTIDGGFAYFMTEQINGGDLDDYISSPTDNLQLAVSITRGILSGLSVLHSPQYRLLHRDLKPANILIDEENNPQIADFGSVKRLPEGEEVINGSRHAILYRPPEAFDDEYGCKGDVYQIGMVLYQLCGGYLPYDPLQYMKRGEQKEYHRLASSYDKSKFVDTIIEDKVKKGKILNLKTLLPFVDNRIKRIIKKATHPDPANRYNDCSEFELALHKLGDIPGWERNNKDGFKLSNQKGKNYRVVHKKNGIFLCQKVNMGNNNWRKESKITEGSESQVVAEMCEKLH